MSETQNLSVAKNDLSGYYLARQRANLIKDGIENNTAPFLPTDGKVKPILICSASTGFALDARAMIPAVLKKTKEGYESNVVGAYGVVGKAGTKIKEGEHGVGVMFKNKDEEIKSAHLYFPEQMEDPAKFKEFAQKNIKQEMRLTGQTFTITSPEVTEYLGAYVAACQSGASVSVSPEVAEKFKANLSAVVDNELAKSAEKNPDIPKLGDLLFETDKKAFELVKGREKELGLTQKIEKAQEQKPKQHKREKSQSMDR